VSDNQKLFIVKPDCGLPTENCVLYISPQKTNIILFLLFTRAFMLNIMSPIVS